MEQMRAQLAASSIGPKEALGLNQPRQSFLGTFELIESRLPIQLTQRSAVSESMIPDAVAFFTRAHCDSGSSRLTDFPAEHEESSFQIVIGEAIEHEWSYERFRPVVKSQGNFPHQMPAVSASRRLFLIGHLPVTRRSV
jgi:hypothetical protein